MSDNEESDFRRTKVSVIKTEFRITVTEKDLTDKLVNRIEGDFLTPDEITDHTPDETANSKN